MSESLPESRLYTFIDHAREYALYFLEGQRLIRELALSVQDAFVYGRLKIFGCCSSRYEKAHVHDFDLTHHVRILGRVQEPFRDLCNLFFALFLGCGFLFLLSLGL